MASSGWLYKSASVSAFLALSGFTLIGCAGNPVTFNPTYDFSKVKRIAILGFEPYEGADSSGKAMSAVFEKYFIQAGYNLVERQNVEQVLKEQNFELSGAVDPQQAIKLGKVLNVDALVFGTVTIYTPQQSSVIMVDVDTAAREPVVSHRTYDVVQDGKHVTESADVIVDYKETHRRESGPQIYRVGAESGVVVKMVDTSSGEIAWVGTDSDEGNNIQVANEYVAERIVNSLKKFWPLTKKER